MIRGIAGGDLVVRQPPLVEGAGLEVGDEDVGLLGELEEHLSALRFAEIDRDAALSPIAGDEVRRLEHGRRRREPAALVADPRELDLHDIGAPVSEHRCRLRALHEQPGFQHLDSVECTHGRRPYWPTRTRLGSDVTDSVRAISDVCDKIPEDRVSEILSQTWIFGPDVLEGQSL